MSTVTSDYIIAVAMNAGSDTGGKGEKRAELWEKDDKAAGSGCDPWRQEMTARRGTGAGGSGWF